ncbi:unnamed protein product [Cladocopium goreaui]|uniref:Hypoxia-inducible factor 1-alpha inhibitor (Hypoxia-inducible factor asparagine hydroxylase) n=1 Tax=Cladocopium goreaui TaxID=2562237 RepID=A0A9P1FQS5_9DINO|nr:unnamed protein product [Cladocopium goreaui]
MERLRRACMKTSKQLWQVIDEEWRHSPPASLDDFDRFPASLLHLAPPPHAPVLPRSNTVRTTCRGAQQSEYPKPKVAEVFLGKGCDVIDSTSEEEMKQLEDVLKPSSQRPALLKHLARRCFPGNWTFEHLSQRGGDVVVDGVRLGTGDGGYTFHYADESKDACFTDRNAQHQLADAMSLADFLAAGRQEGPGLYLWLVLLQSKQGIIQRSALAERLREELDAMDWDILKKISELGDLGSLKKLQLFCGVGGTVTACHYDQSQNLFFQLQGTKRFILFPPLVGAGALLPFPIAHPRDRCARAPLDQTFPKQSHLAHGQGIEVIVEAGDCLFLPQMWWHHVESLCAENLSLSLWLQGGALDRRPMPMPGMPQALVAELLREWEFYLASHIGYGPELELFLLWLRSPSSATGDASIPYEWLRCGALLLQHAIRLLPPQWLPHFLGAFDVHRFHGLDLRSSTAPRRGGPACARKHAWPQQRKMKGEGWPGWPKEVHHNHNSFLCF